MSTTSEIFADASFDPRSRRGVGACCISSEIITKEFSTTSCARLELVTVLWALKVFEDLSNDPINKLTLYTDSKTLVDLAARRPKLEANNFSSRRNGKELSNGDLYQEFFAVCDRLRLKLELNIIWIKGHTPSTGRTQEQAIFSKVDHAARAELRRLLQG